jgi:hypothetical protein
VPEAEAPAGEEAELTDDQLLALAMGLDPAKVAPPEPEPAPAEVVPQMPAAAAALALDAGWGVRLVAVLPNTQPPRAVLGLASGEEVVVEPGSFVEAARVVVLAVGSEGVQVAYVEPNGDRTKVRTEMLSPLNRADRVIVPQ